MTRFDHRARALVAPDPAPTPECRETADNILGPYYREGAPMRSRLVEEPHAGVPLRVTGRVISTRGVRPLTGALLDIWQADENGHYDNDGHLGDAPPFLLRGRLHTGEGGLYQFDTIVPGHYLDGAQYRPAHLHVRLDTADHRPLVTQIYFAGDPYNAIDPFIKPSLVVRLVDVGGGRRAARFDFALAPG